MCRQMLVPSNMSAFCSHAGKLRAESERGYYLAIHREEIAETLPDQQLGIGPPRLPPRAPAQFKWESASTSLLVLAIRSLHDICTV